MDFAHFFKLEIYSELEEKEFKIKNQYNINHGRELYYTGKIYATNYLARF
jgi:hypothetical protein